MRVHLNRESGVPVYRQIVDQVTQMVAAGRLPPGAAVDSIRSLAEQLHINPLTVAKAYARLAARGVLRTTPRSGVVVADHAGVLARPARRKRLAELLGQVVAEAFQLDVSANEVVALLKEKFDESADGRASSPPPRPGGSTGGRKRRRSTVPPPAPAPRPAPNQSPPREPEEDITLL